MKKLLLIDGNSLIHRAYHALPEFTSPNGQPVGAVYGFARMLLTALKKRKPDSVIVAWDTAKPTFRHEMYVEYKQHRPETDESLRLQIGLTQNLVATFGIEQFFVEGYEADDVIATTVEKFQELHKSACCVEILSSDMDMLQLVKNDVYVVAVKKGMSELELFNPAEVKDKYELTPEQLPDLKGLMGDSSDNIPGVKGVGIKTATALLVEYGSLENVYEHIEKIKGKTKELLSSQYEMAILSKQLATIRADAPIQLEQGSDYTYSINRENVQQLFQEHGFKSLYPLLHDLSEPVRISESSGVTVGEINEIFWEEAKSPFWFVVLNKAAEALYVFFTGESVWKITGNTIHDKSLSQQLSQLLQHSTVIAFDVKELKHFLHMYAIEIGAYEDMSILGSMLDRRRVDSLDEIYLSHTGVSYASSDAVKSALLHVSNLPQLYDALIQKLEVEEEIKELVRTIEMPLVDVLFRMEMHGVLLDQTTLAHIHMQLLQRQERIKEEIYETIGHEVNIQSPKQLESVLFDELRLPVIKRTKTQRSTNEAVLLQLVHAHPVVQKILDYRTVSKLTSTYTEKLPEMADEHSRIHTTYNQLKVITSRVSSDSPNLQNIPRDKEAGVRSAFIAPSGYRMVVLDYSQIELRILAHLSGDVRLQESFRAGQDIHTVTAAKLFNTFVDEITDRQRQIAKVVNFAVMYGMGPHALSENLRIEYVEAKKYIDDFFDFYPEVKAWRDVTIAFARENGYVKTLWGRVISIPEITASNRRLASAGERMATNYPNQGTQADLIKKAMVDIDAYLKKENLTDVHMVMQVHDELVFEIPSEKVAQCAAAIRKIMEEVIDLAVPVRVDCKVGKNWQETEKVE